MASAQENGSFPLNRPMARRFGAPGTSQVMKDWEKTRALIQEVAERTPTVGSIAPETMAKWQEQAQKLAARTWSAEEISIDTERLRRQIKAAGVTDKQQLATLSESVRQALPEGLKAFGGDVALTRGQRRSLEALSRELSKHVSEVTGKPLTRGMPSARQFAEAERAVRQAERFDLLDGPVAPAPSAAVPSAPTPAPAEPEVRPDELSEIFAAAVAREDHESVERLLVDAELEHELEHLETLQARLHSGGRADRLDAALNASHLLKGLADHLFPPQNGEWESRFGTMHTLGEREAANRLSAYVDAHLRPELSAHEHKLFQARLDFASNWSGEGHHKPYSPRGAAEAYCHLLGALAIVERAYRADDGA